MTNERPLSDLIDHLVRSTRLAPREAEGVVEEVLAYLSEPAPTFVCRRHQELRLEGRTNPEIFVELRKEVAARRFPAPALSERQIRRIIYG